MLIIGNAENKIRIGNGIGGALEFLKSDNDDVETIKNHCQEFLNAINKMDDEDIQELTKLIKE